MPFFHPTDSDFDFGGKTLVIPVVSTANLPQLAVDLLITSLGLRLLGVFDSQYFVPAVGSRDGGIDGITTPLELFGLQDSNIIVIQQRSPVLKTKKQAFIDELFRFIETSGVQSTLFLSGVDMSNRTDAQMMTPLYYIQPQSPTQTMPGPLSNLQKLHVPEYTFPGAQHPTGISKESAIPFIPGGGLTRRILASIPDGSSIPVAALLQFVQEGDNQGDAHMFASAISKILDVDERMNWRVPDSWKQGLFGAPHDQTLYG
ncbi:hypothetical protein ONZ45_g8058 [Pleurotus djamor]|nr:hypothetical protein ONZ45_g8058 [Pleurotus djamor]